MFELDLGQRRERQAGAFRCLAFPKERPGNAADGIRKDQQPTGIAREPIRLSPFAVIVIDRDIRKASLCNKVDRQ